MLKKKYLFVFLFLFMVIISTIFFLRSSLPKTSGVIDLPDISDPVKIIRDRWGVPHIYAGNEEDAHIALGYVLASDRLFQMDIYRRLSKGTLSEIFGNDTLKLDTLFRTLRFRSHMVKHYNKKKEGMNPKMLKLLEAFIKGINYYIENETLPYEFTLLRYSPLKFDVEDAFAFTGYMGMMFSTALNQEILFEKLLKRYSREMIEVLRTNSTINSSTDNSFSYKSININFLVDALDGLAKFSQFEGSNAWVLSSKRSKSGRPILANDPHIGFSLPGIWYEAHIDTPQYKIYGHFLPIIPFPILGHNESYGWGLTLSYTDDMDIYREILNKDKTKVKFKNKWVNTSKYTEKIKIKGKITKKLDLILTPHGPLLDHVLDGENLSLKWSFYDDDNLPMDALYGLGHAKNVDDFKNAISKASSPGLNILYADQNNIGWWVLGKIPIRNKNSTPDFVLNGANGLDEYIGYISFEDKPSQYNPKSGLIVSANYRPFGKKSKIFGNWGPPNRYLLISSLLGKKDKWDLEELKEIQTKNQDYSTRFELSVLLQSINDKLAQNPQYLEINNLLKVWNHISSKESVPAAIFHRWRRENIRLILDELTPDELKMYCKLESKDYFYKRLLQLPQNRWWDRQNTKKVEKLDDILLMGFENTLKYFTARFGKKISDWKWGKIHTLEYIHPLGINFPLNLIFNLGPYEVPGGYNQINNMRDTQCSNEITVKAGPSTRRLIDFSNPKISYGILPLGNSGHMLSKNFNDQVDLFISGRYRQQIMDKEIIIKDNVGVLTLK